MTDRQLTHLEPGDVVRALVDYDPEGANLKPGDLGVVFREAGFHEPHTGPMVRWMIQHDGMKGRMCNVYEGIVEKVEY